MEKVVGVLSIDFINGKEGKEEIESSYFHEIDTELERLYLDLGNIRKGIIENIKTKQALVFLKGKDVTDIILPEFYTRFSCIRIEISQKL